MPRIVRPAACLLLLALMLAFPNVAAALPQAATELIDAFVLAEADRESKRNQSESPSMADSTTNIIERSSVPDFLGLAFNPGAVTQESKADDERTNSYSASLSMESVLAGISGTGPWNNDYFYEGGGWRGLVRSTALIAGYDDPTGGDLRPARRFGFKTRLLGDGDVVEGWPGLKFLKTTSAHILSRPARALFRPNDLEIEPGNDTLKGQLRQFRGEAMAAEDTARHSLRDADRWAVRVCGTNERDGNGKKISPTMDLSKKFPLPSARGRNDLNDAYQKVGDYLYYLLCRENGVAALIKPEKRGEFVGLLNGEGARPTSDAVPRDGAKWLTESRKKLDESGAEVAFALLLQKNEDWKPIRKIGWTELGGRPRDHDRSAELAHKALLALHNTGILTDLGLAVRAWALDDFDGALEILGQYVAKLDKEHDGLVARYSAENFNQRAGALVDEINKRTELSFEFQSKLRRGMEDEHTALLVLEASPFKNCSVFQTSCNYLRYLNFTVNAGFDLVDDHESSEQYGGTFGLEVEMPFDISSIFLEEYVPNLRANLPVLSFSGKARWLEDGNDMYVGQAKLAFNLPGGVQLPLTFTVADRTALQADTDLRVQLGFVMDTSKLVNLLTPKIAPPVAGASGTGSASTSAAKAGGAP